MAKELLTERAVRGVQLPAGRSETALFDGDGLVLRVRASRVAGAPLVCSWQLWHQAGGTRQKVSIGSYPKVGITKARRLAAEYRELLAAGITLPRTRRGRTPVGVAGPLVPGTVGELMDRWEQDYLRLHHKDKGAAVRAAYRRHVEAHIGRTPLLRVRKLHVQHVLGALTAADKGRTAAGVLAMMRQMFRWAVRHDFLAADPTAALVKAEFAGRTTPRERVLTGAEVRTLAERLAVVRRAGPAGRERTIPALPHATQAAVWVLLSTCARVGELSRAEWEHVDLEAGRWLIPAEHAKNGRPHLVHLSAFAVRHLRQLHQLAAGSAWVLPNRDGKDHLDVQAITKQLRDRQQLDPQRARAGRSSQRGALLLPGGIFTAHDLRRTGATLMQALGVETRVIERCLNHTEADALVRTYQRAELMPERQEAFARLGARLEELVPAALTAHLTVRGAA